MHFPTDYEMESYINSKIETSIMCGLEIDTEWVGDPATSVFGIKIKLLYNGIQVSETIVDFIGKTV